MNGWPVFGLMALLAAITVALIWASVAQDKLGTEAVRDLNRLASDIRADNAYEAHGSTPTPEEVRALAWAMWQLLDDMGEHGDSVCLAAKAQARIAYEPFWQAEAADDPDMEPMDMPLSEAKAILADL